VASMGPKMRKAKMYERVCTTCRSPFKCNGVCGDPERLATEHRKYCFCKKCASQRNPVRRYYFKNGKPFPPSYCYVERTLSDPWMQIL